MTLILYNVFIGDFRGTLYVYFTPIPLRGSIVSSYAFAEPLGSKICKGAEIGRTPERRFKCCSRTDIDSYMSLWFWSIRCPKLSTIYYNRYVVKLCWWVRLRGSQNHNQLTFIRCQADSRKIPLHFFFISWRRPIFRCLYLFISVTFTLPGFSEAEGTVFSGL